jgi:hypothetical protein
MKKLILFILIAFFSKQLSAQQAWTRAKGSYFAQIGWTPDNYDGIIPNGGGKVVLANRDFSKRNLIKSTIILKAHQRCRILVICHYSLFFSPSGA